ncbi:MAG: hypothetical protein ABII79_09015 [bacterium]
MRREGLVPIVVAVLLSGLSIYLHFVGGTSLTQEADIWDKRVQLHREYYPLSRRCFTTQSLSFLHDTFEIPYRDAFIMLQYGLCLLLSAAFYVFLRELGFTRFKANVGLALLLSSYPILCAHFQPVHTWDDFWQYLGSVVALLLAFRGKLLLSAFVLSVACVARESTLLIYPAYLLVVLSQRQLNTWSRTMAALLPLAISFVYLVFTFRPPDPVRFHNFDKNFMDPTWASHTVFSLLVSFGSLWLTSLLGLIVAGRSLVSDWRSSVVVLGAVYLVPTVVVSTLTLALARETRLFFPPFLFLIPLTLWFWEQMASHLRTFYTRWFGIPGILLLAVSIMGGILAAESLFPTFDFRAWPGFAQTYLGIHIGISISISVPLVLVVAQRCRCTLQKRPEA